MTEQLLPDKLTPCTPAALYASLQAAWPAVVPDAPCTRNALLVLLAHWSLETGFGHSMHGYNLGNKKHVPGDGHDYMQFRCNEIIAGKVVWISPPDPGCSFVAFASLDEGAADYLHGLVGQFRSAWPAVLAGDPAEFCHLLKLAHYYTADEALYTAGVVRCFHQLDGQIPAAPDPAAPDPGDPVAGGIPIPSSAMQSQPSPEDT